MVNEEVNNNSILAEYLTNAYIGIMSGSSDSDILVDQKPDKRYMVGTLAADRVVRTLNNKYVENGSTKWDSVPSISVGFIVKRESKGQLIIKINGYLYYRIEPIYSLQVKRYLEKYSRQYNKEFKDLDTLLQQLASDGVTALEVSSFYKRIRLDEIIEPIIVPVTDLLQNRKLSMRDRISDMIRGGVSTLREESIAGTIGKVSIDKVGSESNFTSITRVGDESHIEPSWDIDLFIESMVQGDDLRVTLRLVNLTNMPTEAKSVSYSPTIFNAGLEVKGENVAFQSIKLDFFIEDYKQRPEVFSIAENTTSYYDAANNVLATENIPLFLQKRTRTKKCNLKNLEFSALIRDPIRNLEEIAGAMEKDYELLYQRFLEAKDSNASIIKYDKKPMERYEQDIDLYLQEIKRFKAGIDILKRKDPALRAFKYMNESFAERCYPSQNVYSGWHAFQLVFIVSLINDIVHSEYEGDPALKYSDPEIVDVLYFPTGGGKTEAFFGAVVFAAFFDRLRGKEDGVTAMVKYPLRLLSMDQLGRAIATMAKAEAVRSRHPDVSKGAPFSVGYYVGQDNTLNEIKDPTEIETGLSDGIDEKYRVTDICPYCGERAVEVSFDRSSWRLVHKCMREGCGRELELYTIDNEIYRFLPTLIISTIDKLALVGFQAKVKSLYGHVEGKCPAHGYCTMSKCSVPFGVPCNEIIEPIEERRDPVPTLMIQDELHLVRESLGTFDSHYETFIQLYTTRLIEAKYRKKMKFIGASATISNYHDHAWHLYHKHARIFPSPYPIPKVGEDFYSYVDETDVSRCIIGFCPYGRSITESVWESTSAFRELIYQKMTDLPGTHSELVTKGYSADIDQLAYQLDQYWISIIYNTRKQDTVSLNAALQNQANNYLKDRGIPENTIELMSSDVSAKDIRQIRDGIKNQAQNFGGVNMILATSTISHGIDEEAFNNIFFFGMPNNNAEYVQAYSRVGRKQSGIVVDIIRLARERDRSYLKNFTLFHKHKDKLIEPVPINRWAKNAIYLTFPGILNALMLQYYQPLVSSKVGNLFFANNVKKAIRQGLIKIEEVAEQIKAAYGCGVVSELESTTYSEIIDAEVERFFSELEGNHIEDDASTGEALKRFTSRHIAPMTSLRDVDEWLDVVMD